MKLKVKIGEETHEIDREQIEGIVGDEEGKLLIMTQTQFDGTIEGRLSGLKSKHRTALNEVLDDDNQFKQAALNRGITLDVDLKPVAQISSEDRKKIEDGVRLREVTPLKTKLDSTTTALGKERTGNLHRDLLAAAPGKGVKKESLLTTFSPIPEFIKTAAGRFKEDEESGEPYFEDKQGNPVIGTDGKYAPPGDVFDQLRPLDPNFEYFDRVRPKGSGSGDPNAASGSKVVTTEDLQSGDWDPESVVKGETTVVE